MDIKELRRLKLDDLASNKSLPDTRLMDEILASNKRMVEMLTPFSTTSAILDAVNRMVMPHRSMVEEMMQSVRAIGQIRPTIVDHLSDLWTFADAFRTLPFTIPDYFSGLEIDLSPITQSTIQLGAAFKDLKQSLTETTISPDLYQIVVTSPSLSTASHYETVRGLGFYEGDGGNEPSQLDAIVEDDLNDAESIVADENADWAMLFRAADESLASDNPDKIRHAAVSGRELLTNVLHTLSPDELVRSRLTDAHWFHQSRPTRRARIYCILAAASEDDLLLDFVDKDVGACLELFDVLQKATHEIVSSVSENQLRWIMKRAKLLVAELVRCAGGR